MTILHHSSNPSYNTGVHFGLPSGQDRTAESKNRERQAVRSEQPNRVETEECLPTILVAANEELCKTIVPAFEASGYLVFAATNEDEALHFVVTHSRPIHVLLADIDMNGVKLARSLLRYRFEMRAFLIATSSHHFRDALSPAAALAKVRECLGVPKGIVAQMALASKEQARARVTARIA